MPSVFFFRICLGGYTLVGYGGNMRAKIEVMLISSYSVVALLANKTKPIKLAS